MSLFKLLIHGWFADTEDTSTPMTLSLQNDKIEGFYASRLVEAADEATAVKRVTEAIRHELASEMLSGRLDIIANLEVEECSLASECDSVSLTGFTFY